MLPYDLAYVLDEALENWYINAFSHIVLNLYGSSHAIDEILEKPRPAVGGWKDRNGANYIELDNYAHEIAAKLSDEDRRVFFAASLIREPAQLVSLAECYAGWNYEDSTIGGCMENYKRIKLLKRDGTPFPKVQRYLHSPSAIRRYVKTVDTDTMPHYQRLADNLRKLPWPDDPSEADKLADYFTAARQRFEEGRRRAYARLICKPLKPHQRKQLKRAASIAEATVGSQQLRDFRASKAVSFTGPNFEAVVAANHGLLSAGHASLDIELRSSGSKLCDLCLYFDDTPVLDQLVAIALHFEAGTEVELLEIGNPYNVTPAGVSHPLVAKRLMRKAGIPEDIPEDAAGRVVPRLLIPARNPPRQRQETLRAAYVESMSPVYLRPIVERVWGRDSTRLVEFLRRMTAQTPEISAIAA